MQSYEENLRPPNFLHVFSFGGSVFSFSELYISVQELSNARWYSLVGWYAALALASLSASSLDGKPTFTSKCVETIL